VPYGKVWRAGANINTTIAFSDPVTIEGKPLDKGTYGLHMIPTADRWTIIFSRNSTSWGSFTYDSTEDALRVTVTPTPAPMHNVLTYEFDQVQPASAVIELEWAKIAVPFKVAVDVHGVARASMNRQLRTLVRYDWVSWNEAANYLLTEHIELDTALTYANKSIFYGDVYDNEITKSKILTALNRHDEAVAAQKRALDVATPQQVNQFARGLLADKHADEAFAIFRKNATAHPDQWVVHEGLARMYSAQGKFAEAQKEITAARTGAPDAQKGYLDGLAKQLEAKQDINKA
jgi:tetratricopeptide (TPR) repeat protein